MFTSNVDYHRYPLDILKKHHLSNKRSCIIVSIMYIFFMWQIMDIIYYSNGSELLKMILSIFIITTLTIIVCIGIIDLFIENSKINEAIKLKDQ